MKVLVACFLALGMAHGQKCGDINGYVDFKDDLTCFDDTEGCESDVLTKATEIFNSVFNSEEGTRHLAKKEGVVGIDSQMMSYNSCHSCDEYWLCVFQGSCPNRRRLRTTPERMTAADKESASILKNNSCWKKDSKGTKEFKEKMDALLEEAEVKGIKYSIEEYVCGPKCPPS